LALIDLHRHATPQISQKITERGKGWNGGGDGRDVNLQILEFIENN
jgi:hypothetical protein